MTITRTRTRRGLIAVTGIATVGVVAVSYSVAQAGHENAVLEAELSGANEVGADGATNVGDQDGAGQAYVFGIDDDPTTLCYVITAEGIDPTFVEGETGMAHIHRGAEGENGPVVVALAFPLEGDSADCLTEGEEGKFPLTGEAGEPASIVADILANPANYYVNVHTGEFPDGAIRGQLANVHDRVATLDPVASTPVGSAPVASGPDASGPASSEPMGSEPMGSDPMGTEPMGSEPMATEPIAPATSAP